MTTRVEIQFVGADGLSSPVQGIIKSLDEVGNAAGNAGGKASAFSSVMSGVFMGVGMAAFNMASQVVSGLGSVFASAIKEATEEQDQLAQLRAGLVSTGGAAGVTMEMMTGLAASQAKVTKFSDDQTEAIEKIALTFTSVNKNVFPQSIRLAEDLATRFGLEGTQAMTLIGKAMDDPVKGLSALHRIGVSVTEQQKDQVAAFMKTGDVMGAQKVILDELTKEVGGSAVEAGKTLTGQMVILQHGLGDAAQPIGDALIPLLTNLASFVNANVIPAIQRAAEVIGQWITAFGSGLSSAEDAILGFAQSFAGNPFQTIVDMLNSIIPGLGDFAAEAYTWGSKIVGELAGGLMDGMSVIVDAMVSIGNVIASWLEPHSPPKIAPNLDKWGAKASQIYMDSWGDVDFKVFGDLSKTIQTTLQGMVDAGKSALPAEGIIPMVLGSQSAIADMVNELRDTGSVAEATIQKVVAAAGDAGPQVESLVRGYVDLNRATQDVSQAQDDLNRVTQEYNDRLVPLNAEMQKIRDRRDELRDAKRVADLEKTIGDGKKTAAEKEDARLEIQEIQMNKQIKGVESERDTAVNAAKAKLDAAKKQQEMAAASLKAQQDQIAAQNEQNHLISQQISLLERLTKEQEAAAKKGAGGGGGGATVPTGENPLTKISQDLGSATVAIDGFKSKVSGAMGEVKAAFAPVAEVIGSVVSVAKAGFPIFAAVVDTAHKAIQQTINNVWGAVGKYIPAIIQSVRDFVGAALTVIKNFWDANGTDIMTFAKTTWDTIQTIVKGATALISMIVIGAFKLVADFLHNHGREIQGILTDTWTVIKSVIDGALAIIKGLITAALAIMKGDWSGAWEAIKAMSVAVVKDIGAILGAWFDSVLRLFGTSKDAVVKTWSDIWDMIKSITTTAIDSLTGWVSGLMDKIQGAINAAKKLLGIKSPDSSAGANAAGTDYFGGGLTWVGETGPELVNLPRGSQIYSSNESKQMGGGNTYHIDARGSALTERQIRAQFEAALKTVGVQARNRGLAGGF